MYKVVFDAIKTNNMNSGLGRFCNSLAHELIDQNKDFIIECIVNKIDLNLDFVFQKKLSVFQSIFGIKHTTILHQTHQESKLFVGDKKTKIVLTIHDLNFLEKKYSESKKNNKLNLIQKKINRADVVVYISEYTKNLVNSNLKLENKQQFVIYNGNTLNVNQQETPLNSIPKNSKFFFSIGMIQEKKNFHVLIPILNTFKDYYLIIAGDQSNSYTQKIVSIAKEFNVEKQLILTGTINDSQKLWLYKNCEAFLFPSLAEGFGLPIIEALSVGAKVVASNKCSLPEIGKNYIHYFNSFEPDKIGCELYEIISKKELFSSQEKINYANTYSWKNAALEYLKIYKSLI
jgi:glycosyltransferase involved in cell wall biosynthesis